MRFSERICPVGAWARVLACYPWQLQEMQQLQTTAPPSRSLGSSKYSLQALLDPPATRPASAMGHGEQTITSSSNVPKDTHRGFFWLAKAINLADRTSELTRVSVLVLPHYCE